jgi:hypothetical protein
MKDVSSRASAPAHVRFASFAAHARREARSSSLPRRVAGAAFALATLAIAAPPAPAASLYYGALVDGRTPTSGSFLAGGAFSTFEQQAGKKMSLIQWGQPWKMNGAMQPFQRSYFDNVRNHGSIPVLNWCSWELGKGVSQPDFQLRDIAAGTYDAYVRGWATDAKSWGHPLMLRFDHEMNGWWYPWGEGTTSTGAIVNNNSRGDYVKAWRRVHDIFNSVGATNVSWMWSPNYTSTSSNYPDLSVLYPGDAYVDWTGLSVYNKPASLWLLPYSLLTGVGTTWMENSYQNVLNVAPTKPIALAEVGSVEAGDGGTKKAAWIRDLLLKQLPAVFPQIKAFMWFDWADSGYETMPIDSSAAALQAFQDSVASPVYAANSYSNLSTSPIPAPGTSTTPPPAPAPIGTVALPAIADSYTTSAAVTSTAGGTSTTLVSDGDPVSTIYLKFDLSAFAGKTLSSVKLRITTAPLTYAGSLNAHSVRLVSDTAWKEAYLSYANSVAVSPTTLGTLGLGTLGGLTYDVTLDRSVVQPWAGGLFSVAIASLGFDGLVISSREGAADPTLFVTA